MFRKFFRVNQECESVVLQGYVIWVAGVLGVFRWFFMGGSGQCVANIWLLEWILFGKGPGGWDSWDSWDGWDGWYGWDSWDQQINRQ